VPRASEAWAASRQLLSMSNHDVIMIRMMSHITSVQPVLQLLIGGRRAARARERSVGGRLSAAPLVSNYEVIMM
jgi:hypothetical protein